MKIDVRGSAELYVAEIGPKAPEYQMPYETLVDCLTNFANLCLNVQKTLPEPKPPAHRGKTVDPVMARNSDTSTPQRWEQTGPDDKRDFERRR